MSEEGGEVVGEEGDLLLFCECLSLSLPSSLKNESGLGLGRRLRLDARLGERGIRLLRGATSDKCSSFFESLGLCPPLCEGSTM